AAVSVALIVALVLAVVALLQRESAIKHSNEATSRALAANAFLNLPTDPELSVLLARRAGGAGHTGQGEDALREALIGSRCGLLLRGHRAAVRDVALSSDGTRVISGSQDGTARIWDAKTGRSMALIPAHGPARAGGIFKVAFSSDGSEVLTAAQNYTV